MFSLKTSSKRKEKKKKHLQNMSVCRCLWKVSDEKYFSSFIYINIMKRFEGKRGFKTVLSCCISANKRRNCGSVTATKQTSNAKKQSLKLGHVTFSDVGPLRFFVVVCFVLSHCQMRSCLLTSPSEGRWEKTKCWKLSSAEAWRQPIKLRKIWIFKAMLCKKKSGKEMDIRLTTNWKTTICEEF